MHPSDLIWAFISKFPGFTAPAQVANHYFSDGHESARKLQEILCRHLGGEAVGNCSLLEFASGYGMVTRHLATLLPNVDLTSCDIHADAVRFIQQELHTRAIGSERTPEDLAVATRFDVVFALSFFSHMPERTFGRWLGALHALVKPGGLLIFTTHGLASAPSFGNPEIPDSGLWFTPVSEQDDLDAADYGSNVTVPAFVIKQLDRFTTAQVVEFQQAYWWGHQDLYVVRKGQSDV